MNVVCVENNFPFYRLQGVIQIIIFARGYGDRNPWADMQSSEIIG